MTARIRAETPQVAPLRAKDEKLEGLMDQWNSMQTNPVENMSTMDAWHSIQTDPVANKSVTVIRLVPALRCFIP